MVVLNKGGEMVFTRIISALMAIPILLFVVMKGGILLKISVMIIAILGLNEFYNAFKVIHYKPSKAIGLVSIITIFFITIENTNPHLIMGWFFLNITLILFYNIFIKKTDIISSVITVFGILYVVFFIYHIVFISNLETYHQLIWLAFITAWSTDTFAYFTGSLIGKNKLCPSISPKKTIEGAVGGVLGSILTSCLFMYLFAPGLLIHGISIGFLGSIAGQTGDLSASVIKRYVDIKDYGKIMPGHGGVLDRFDSILITAPLVYYYILLFII